MKNLILSLLPLAALISCAQKPSNIVENIAGEKHLANVRMLTTEGENAKADFNLWKITIDVSGLEQITFYYEFDGFPMFTRDGKKLVFASSRCNKNPRDTNVLLADWIE